MARKGTQQGEERRALRVAISEGGRQRLPEKVIPEQESGQNGVVVVTAEAHPRQRGHNVRSP